MGCIPHGRECIFGATLIFYEMCFWIVTILISSNWFGISLRNIFNLVDRVFFSISLTGGVAMIVIKIFGFLTADLIASACKILTRFL